MVTSPPTFQTPDFSGPDIPFDVLFDFKEVIFGQFLTPRLFMWAQVISYIISGLFLWGIIYVYRKNKLLESRPVAPSRSPNEKFKNKNVAKDLWLAILHKVQQGTEQDLAFAIIEADKLIDTILKSNGFAGETMAERLRRINPHQLTSLDELWEAHKIRNDIVHTPGYVVTPELAKKVLRNYERVLKELEAI
jgi:hypothetical protein